MGELHGTSTFGHSLPLVKVSRYTLPLLHSIAAVAIERM